MILALNTAFMTANIGLILNNGERVESTIDAKSKHSENVLKTVDELLNKCNEKIQNVDEIAVVVGPGSFTGIRIGVALAKGFGSVNDNLKLLPISSLELMAYIYLQKHSNDFVCVLNALSNLFFVCEFDSNGIKLSNERMIDREELDKIKKKKVCLTGDLNLENADYVEITTDALLDFVAAKQEESAYVKVEELSPIYLRPSQAEANLKSDKKSD